MKLSTVIIALDLLLVGGRDTGLSHEERTSNLHGQRSTVTRHVFHRTSSLRANVDNTLEQNLGRPGSISTRFPRKSRRRRRQKLSHHEDSADREDATSKEEGGLQIMFLSTTGNEEGEVTQELSTETETMQGMGASRDVTLVADNVVIKDSKSDSSENISNNVKDMIITNIENLSPGGRDISGSLEEVITMLNNFQTNITTDKLNVLGSPDKTAKLLDDTNNNSLANFKQENNKRIVNNLNECQEVLNATDRNGNIKHSLRNKTVGLKADGDLNGRTKMQEETDSEKINISICTDDDEGIVVSETIPSSEEETMIKSPTNGFTTIPIDSKAGNDEVVNQNLTRTDEKIVVALMDLEELRGEQQDMEEEIQNKLEELENLLEEEEMNEIQGNNNDNEESNARLQKLLFEQKNKNEKPRGGKTFDSSKIADLDLETLGKKVNTITTTINVFDNLQGQLLNLLQARKFFLDSLSDRISSELDTIKQTLTFLRGIINFKLDQSELLLGKMNPITDLLQSGSTSIFLVITRFFEAVESVLSMKQQFLRAFAVDSNDLREANLLERVKELKLKTILPIKMRILLNIHARSDKLGAMVKEIFNCIGELVDAKRDVIGSVGGFVEGSMEFISGLAGPALSLPVLIAAVKSGNLYKLLNFGPVEQQGVPLIPDEQLEQLVEQLVSSSDIRAPIVNVPVKHLLVNNRLLGTLAGRNRERLVNLFLTRKLSHFLSQSQSELTVNQGETLIKAWLPPLHLGSPCTNEMTLGRSYGSVVVNRNSRFTTLGGLRINSHTPATKDLVGTAWLYVDLDLSGSVRTSVGQEVFGKCLTKFTGSSPLRVRGKARGTAYARVVVNNVRLETRETRHNPLLGKLGLEGDLEEGIIRPHIVFTFNIKLEGSINHFDLSSLNLSGCQFQLLGIKMFSNCGLLESLIKEKLEKFTQNVFPISGDSILRSIESAIKMRIGDEVAIPLALAERNNLEPVNRVVDKTGKLLNLNLRLFHSLASLTQDMEHAEKFPEKKST